jgi:hypothetical protein
MRILEPARYRLRENLPDNLDLLGIADPFAGHEGDANHGHLPRMAKVAMNAGVAVACSSPADRPGMCHPHV